jgi:CubicO group peptidase (beta-lactamase class C family)
MLRILATLLALAVPLLAQSPEQLAKIFSAYQHTDTPGCAAAAEMPGRESWSAAYGMADLEHSVPNTTASVFEVGSVSKQFTAAAVLLLVERGQVSLDDDIRKYFPELPTYQRPVTVKQLLNHTGGLRDWGSVEAIAGWPRTTREYTHAHVLEILSRQHSLNYAPGDAWSYTNSGYNLAAILVERVTGTTLQVFCRKEFFEPLGMSSTQWRDNFRRIVPNRAIAYNKQGNEWRQDMPFEDIYGNGGLLSTVGDLLKWNTNMVTGKLHPTIFATMQKPSTLTDGRTVGYGLGLFLQDFEGLAEVGHSGSTAGYSAWLGRIPSKGLSVAVICNAVANATGFAHQIANLYRNLPKPDPPSPPPGFKPGLYRSVRDNRTVNVDSPTPNQRFADGKMMISNPTYGEDIWERVDQWVPSDLTAFTGSYASDEAETVLTVTLESGKLTLHRRPNSSFPLKPTYTDAFDSPLGSVRFLRDAAGKITALSVGEPRVWDLRFTRHD